jgi:hypothetical protein
MLIETASSSRRGFLRGAGALLALPFMESLVPRPLLANGNTAKPPLRMGIVSLPGVSVFESFTNEMPGPLTRIPSILKPLEFAKDDLLILKGLGQSGRFNEGEVGGHDGNTYAHLTGTAHCSNRGGRVTSSISIDQAVAQVTGEHTYLPSIEMGLNIHPIMYSWRTSESPVPYESDPRMVFERMFRGRKPIVPNWQRRATQIATQVQKTAKSDSYDRSVLDLVLTDAQDLQRTLGRDDLHKLDQYLESVRAVERRIDIREAVLREDLQDAELPGPSKLEDIPREFVPPGTPFDKLQRLVLLDPERHEEYIRILSDLMVLAFQTDSTRVVTLAIGSDDAEFPGVVTVGYERHTHIMEHRGNHDNPQLREPIAREGLRQIHTWYTSLLAEAVRKMKAIDEGGSSLLDNCMILYNSYMANGGHGTQNFPVALIGKAQGKLKPGRQVEYQKRTPMANLYVELLNRMGVPVDSFGESMLASTPAYGGRLPDLS